MPTSREYLLVVATLVAAVAFGCAGRRVPGPEEEKFRSAFDSKIRAAERSERDCNISTRAQEALTIYTDESGILDPDRTRLLIREIETFPGGGPEMSEAISFLSENLKAHETWDFSDSTRLPGCDYSAYQRSVRVAADSLAKQPGFAKTPEWRRLRESVARNALRDLSTPGFLPRTQAHLVALLELHRTETIAPSVAEIQALLTRGAEIQSAIQRSAGGVALGGNPDFWSERERRQFSAFILSEYLLEDLHRQVALGLIKKVQ